MKRRARRATVATSALLCLVMAGCAGSGTSGTPSPGSSSEPVKVNIVGDLVGAIALPVTAGIKEGIFRKHGIDLVFTTVQSDSQVVAALQSEQATVGIASTNAPMLTNAAAGSTVIKAIAGLESKTPLQVTVRPDINSFADLRGKKLAQIAPRDVTAALLSYILKSQANIDPSEVTFVTAGLGPAATAALIANQVQGCVIIQPQVQQAKDAGMKVLGYAGDFVQTGPAPLVLTSAKALQSHEDVVRKVLAGILETSQWLVDNPDKAQQDLAEIAKITADVAKLAYADTVKFYNPTGKLSQAGLEQWRDIEIQYSGFKPTELQPVAEWLDLSYLA